MGCCSKEFAGAVDVLSRVLANTYVLMVKTQNVHWNVVGSNFNAIHLLTESHYEDMFTAVDLIAEQIRKIGEKAPGTLEEFIKLSCVSDELNAKDATEMIKVLLEDHQTMICGLKKAIASLADSTDFSTIDLLGSRLAFHEKAAWMLKANLGE